MERSNRAGREVHISVERLEKRRRAKELTRMPGRLLSAGGAKQFSPECSAAELREKRQENPNPEKG